MLGYKCSTLIGNFLPYSRPRLSHQHISFCHLKLPYVLATTATTMHAFVNIQEARSYTCLGPIKFSITAPTCISTVTHIIKRPSSTMIAPGP
jgi:hypothetical protein